MSKGRKSKKPKKAAPTPPPAAPTEDSPAAESASGSEPESASESALVSESGSESESESESAHEPDGDAPGISTDPVSEPVSETSIEQLDVEATVNLTGELFSIPGRDDLEAPTQAALPDAIVQGLPGATRQHLRGLLEALIFASDKPIKPGELAKTASAQLKEVKEILLEIRADHQHRGIQLEEIAGGWLFRTSPVYAPFVRDLTKQKPVKLSRAQIETLAILAYRQPITRPEIDEIRGVDSGPVLKILLERDLVRILGKKDEPGRPLLYGTTNEFLEFFGLKSVKDLPTLREFTELSEDSRRVVEEELGETLDSAQTAALEAEKMAAELRAEGDEAPHDTVAPPDVMPEESFEDDANGAADSIAFTETEVVTTTSGDTDVPDEFAEDDSNDAEKPAARGDEDEEPADGDSDDDFDDDDDDDDEDDEDDEDDDEDEEVVVGEDVTPKDVTPEDATPADVTPEDVAPHDPESSDHEPS